MQCMWQKAGEQNKRQQSPLARGPPRENKASHWVSSPSICWSFEENGGQCLCEWVGLRAAQRRMAAMWSGGRRKATSVRCNSCSLVFFPKNVEFSLRWQDTWSGTWWRTLKQCAWDENPLWYNASCKLFQNLFASWSFLNKCEILSYNAWTHFQQAES